MLENETGLNKVRVNLLNEQEQKIFLWDATQIDYGMV